MGKLWFHPHGNLCSSNFKNVTAPGRHRSLRYLDRTTFLRRDTQSRSSLRLGSHVCFSFFLSFLFFLFFFLPSFHFCFISQNDGSTDVSRMRQKFLSFPGKDVLSQINSVKRKFLRTWETCVPYAACLSVKFLTTQLSCYLYVVLEDGDRHTYAHTYTHMWGCTPM